MKDGYPERVCDYCQLQLNTFHAFVKKAKLTSNQFDSILNESKIIGKNVQVTDNSELILINDSDYEVTSKDDVEKVERNSQQSIEMEFLIDKPKDKHTSNEHIIIDECFEDGNSFQ